MAKMAAKVPVTQEVDVPFVKDVRTTGEGQSTYLNIKSAKYDINLFPVSYSSGGQKKTRLVYNCSVVIDNRFAFRSQIREFVDTGALIIGERGSRQGFHCVVSEWNAQQRTAYERTFISEQDYKEIILIITKAVSDE